MKRRREQLSEEEEEQLSEEEEEEELWEEEPQEEGVIHWEETVRWAETEEFGEEEELERELEEEPREKEEEVEEFDEEEFERELIEAIPEEKEEEEKLEEEPRKKEEYFQKLPLELYHNISHQLSSLEDIFNFCLTSKTNWYNICGNSNFWLERARQENLSPTLTSKQFTSKDTTPLLVYLSLYIKKYNKLPVSSNKLIRFLLSSPIDLVEHIEWILKYDIMSPKNLIDFAFKYDDADIIIGLISSPTYLEDISLRPSFSLEDIYERAMRNDRPKILNALEGFREMGWFF